MYQRSDKKSPSEQTTTRNDGNRSAPHPVRRRLCERYTVKQKTTVLYLLLTVVCLIKWPATSIADERPNIVWIIVDDMSANFSCYGETAIQTPNVDALAQRGVRFTNAYVTAPVCSTCRSAFITGMYQTAIGAHHHRSGRGAEKITLPEDIPMVPALFQNAGYQTSITGWPVKPKNRKGKTDYNFEWDEDIYDSTDWTEREPDQPFFCQIQTPGGKRRGASKEQAQKFQEQCESLFGNITRISDVTLPPYYPNEPAILQDWAAYLDSCRYTDNLVGEVVARLKETGDYDNTIILFMTDHGISHARGKQFLYDEGLHVPLVIAGPGLDSGVTRTDLVEHIDIAAMSLGLAGIDIPATMQAKDILAKNYQSRDAVFSARDRCDETVDHIRSVRTKRFKYIRNYLPARPHLQPCAYKDKKEILKALRSAHQEGRLNELQAKLLFADSRPEEELYDLQADPFETRNLADNPKFKNQLKELRGRLQEWEKDTNDQGRAPESDAMFDSDMKLYVDTIKRKGTAQHQQTLADNIELMRKWKREGK